MKKTLITILIAFLCGIVLSGFTIYSLKDKFGLLEDKNMVTAFQIGVYKSIENAEEMVSKYPGAISVKDGEYYRVYVGVAKNDNCSEILATYFLNQNISVYQRKIEVTKKFLNEINLYEKEINKSDINVYERTNQEMMKKLKGEIL